MRAFNLVLFIASVVALSHAQGQTTTPADMPPDMPPKIRAFFNATKRVGMIDLSTQSSDTLGDMFGGMLELVLTNPTEGDLDVNIAGYYNDRCMPDSNALELFSMDETIAAGEQSVDVAAQAEWINLRDIKCGTGCFYANVSASGVRSGFARLALNGMCEQGAVDLSIVDGDLDLDNEYPIVMGEPLLDQIPDLEGAVLRNLGEDMLPNVRDFGNSVMVFFRYQPFSQKDVDEAVSGNCTWDYHGGEYGTTTESSRGKRSASKVKRETQNRKKRNTWGDDWSPVAEVYDAWYNKREEYKIDKNGPDYPMCASQRFLHMDGVLTGGDIMMPEVDANGEATIDFSGVKLESKRHPCWSSNTDMNNIAKFQLIISPDPFAMYNDTDHCNDAIVLNVSMDCSNVDWPETQCDLLVDPLSRGHKATFTYYGQPYLQYDGQKMMFDEESGDWCPSFEYYSGLTDLTRFKALADRFQREMEEDPSMCDVMDELENSDERADVRAPEESERARNKRQIGGGGGGGGVGGAGGGGDGERLEKIRFLMGFIQNLTRDFDGAMNHVHTAAWYTCRLERMELLVQMLRLADDSDEMRRWTEAQGKLEELYEEHEATLMRMNCDDMTDGAEDEGMLPSEESFIMEEVAGLIERGGEAAEALGAAFEEYMAMQMEMGDQDFHSMNDSRRLQFLLSKFESDNDTCPNSRGRTMSGKVAGLQKLIQMTTRAVNAAVNGAMMEPLPFETCGMRKLRALLKNGAGKLMNKDITRWNANRKTAQDDLVLQARFARALNESLAETSDLDDLIGLVEQKMNDSSDAELLRCGSRIENNQRFYEVDDTFDIYWMVRGGKIFQGIRSPLEDGFGEDNGERRNYIWKQMASCSCRQCGDDFMIDPDFGWNNGGGGGGRGFWPGSTTPDWDNWGNWGSYGSSSTDSPVG